MKRESDALKLEPEPIRKDPYTPGSSKIVLLNSPSPNASPNPSPTPSHNGLSLEEINKQKSISHLTASVPKCTICHSNKNVFEDHHNGCLICRKCGLQIGGAMIATGAEWRTFSDDGTKKTVDPSRVGSVDDDLYGIGMSIGGAGILANRHAQTSRSSTEKTFQNAIDICRRIGQRLQLSDDIMKDARTLCHKVVNAPVELRGKTLKLDSLAAVCIYIACQNQKQDRKKDEIVDVAEVSEKAFNKQKKRVDTIIHKTRTAGDPVYSSGSNSQNFIRRYVEKLDLPEVLIDICSCVVTDAKDTKDISSQPSSLAGAAIYFVALLMQIEISIERVSYICGTSANTILEISRLLHDSRLDIVPNGVVEPDVLRNMPKPK